MIPRPRLAALLLLVLYAGFMVSTNNRLTILDDEAIIASVANNSISFTLGSFLHGTGQHEHPPLSDLFLHGWLLLTRRSLAWLRVFANIFFILGLIPLAKCGELIAGRKAAWAVLLLATLWPFGYFYARIAGWYCFCFFLVSLVFICYFRLVRSPGSVRWAAFAAASILLVWSNYYGIAILLLLLADMLLLEMPVVRKQPLSLALACCSIIISFLPLLPALMSDAGGTVKPEALTWTASFVRSAFMLFAAFASVSVAPWFLPWSIPCGVAMLFLLVSLLVHRASRRLTIHFLLSIAGLVLTSHLDLKRILFVTPALLLAMALAISTAAPRSAVAIIAATSLVFSIGWLGIVTRAHPATGNFYEPWRMVADRIAAQATPGGAIVSDSGLFFFYLDSSLTNHSVPVSELPGTPAYRHRYKKDVFLVSLPPDTSPGSFRTVTSVRGATPDTEVARRADHTVVELSRACRLTDSQRYAPDPAAAYKRLFDPAAPILDYRIAVDRFDCSVSHP